MQGSQAVIPTSLQAEVIELGPQRSHGSRQDPKPAKTVLLVSRQLGQLVREYVRTCLACAAAVSPCT